MQTFTDYLRLQGLSLRSICQYRQIAEAWADSGLEPVEYCARGDPAGSTHNQRKSAIRHFYRYCGDEPPAIRSWRVGKEPPRYIGVDETAAWLAEIKKISAREYAAACLMYSAGLRAGEIVSLELEQLDLDNRVLRVRGKGSKVRQVPCDAEVAAPTVAAYLKWIRPRLERWDSPTRVFLADHGGEYQPRMLTRAVRLGARRAGLPELERPNHKLRHSYATHLLEGGLGIHKLRQLLGHSNLNTTQIYASVNMEKIKGDYDSAHPLARSKARAEVELLEEQAS